MPYTKRFSNQGSSNRLSDRDMLMDLLNTEKQMSHMYDHAITESTNLSVLNTFEQLQHDEHENSHTVFTAMQERGWYSPTSDTSGQKRGARFGRGLANSNYAVTSGSQNFGSNLESNNHKSSTRSNKYMSRTGGQTEYSGYHPDWQ